MESGLYAENKEKMREGAQENDRDYSPGQRLLQETVFVRNVPSSEAFTVIPALKSDSGESNAELLGRVGSVGSIIASPIMLRASEFPLQADIAALAVKYPASAWSRWKSGMNPRVQLENIASWEKVGCNLHPESVQLLNKCRDRGLKNGLYLSLGGAAINFTLDKTVFKSSHYGVASGLFDSVGMFAIASVPFVHPAFKLPAMVAGHIAARKLDDYNFAENERKKQNASSAKLNMLR